MRENIKYALLTFWFIIVMAVGIIAGGYSDTHYSVVAEVLSNENNNVLLVDGAGYVWEVSNRPELLEGNMIRINFFNNGTTQTRKDDIITSIKLLDN